MKVLGPLILSVVIAYPVRPLAGQFGSGAYRPASRAQTALARRADRDVYPQDVRDSLARYSSVLIAWPGIVRRVDSAAVSDSITLVVEHHYFDWKEDHGCQRELYFVSPRGEGVFTLKLPRVASRTSTFTGHPAMGALVIAYGSPIAIDTLEGQPSITLSAAGGNIIEAGLYRTDAFSYGRGFSDFQLLKVPECSR